MNADWQDLFNRMADGIQLEADERELAAILKSSAEARRAYRAFMEIHSALHWDSSCLASQGGPPPTGSPDKTPGTRGFDPRRFAAAIALAIGAFTAAAMILPWRERLTVATVESGGQDASEPAPLAVVARTRFLVPRGDGPVPEAGRPFAGGRLAIGGGAVELSLRNGVVVVFEGPGELDLLDDMTAILHDGRVVVRMPKGTHGFRLRTPSADVLDLGTEFAVSVGGGNLTDVQVYDGAVLASAGSRPDAAQPPKRLEAGQAARFSSERAVEPKPLEYRPERFVRELPADVPIPWHGLPEPKSASEIWLYGRPQRDSITVHRAPPVVVVDGNLEEWTDKPGFAETRDGTADCPEWADGRMMFDDRCLYIAAHIGDPMPMRGIIDPEVDAGYGWQSGGVQVRVSTDRRMGWPARGNSWGYYRLRQIEPTAEQMELAANPRFAHLTMWFHAPTKTPCLTIVDGMLTGPLVVNPAGFSGAFRADDDGKGYTLEYAIPWTLLGCADDSPRSGDALAAVWQVNWSDEAGRMRREHMVEVRNREEPLRINVWERAATWGRAEYR
jgi:ferric-dicitrate binding protein FerR (iron transport regulator)